MQTAILSNLTKLDHWLLARCAVGYRAEPSHMKEATPGVVNLLKYLDGLNYRDRDLVIRQHIDTDDYNRIVSTDPESRCPAAMVDDTHTWTIIHASELKNLPPVEWLVRGEIPRGGLVVLFGQSGAGKSFLSLDYALRLAQEHKVVYIAAEGEWGYRQRVEAWCKHHKQSEGSLYMCLGAVNLYDHRDFNAFIDKVTGLEPVLVVVDTLAMCMTGANENDTRDMGLVVNACKHLQRVLGCAVMIVHHVNKGGVAERGSGVLRGAADTMIKVSPMDDVIAVESSKTKDIAAFPTRYIKLLPVPLGTDDEGNEISSVVVLPADKVIQSKDDALTNNQRKVLDSLALEVFTDGASLADIAEVTELGRGNVWKIVSRLIAMEHVVKSGTGYKITERGRLCIGAQSDSTDSTDSGDSTDSKSKNGGVSGVSGVTPRSFPQNGSKTDSGRNGHMESVESDTQLTWDEMVEQAKPKRTKNQYTMGY